jgi:hypothetical protein
VPNSVATSATVAGISATLNTRFSGSVVAGVASVTSAPALRLGRFAAINYFSAMKHLLHLAPVLLGLAACQSSPTTPTAVAPVTATPAAPAPVTAVASEHIDSDSLTVNGQPHRQLTTRQLTSQLGRPDSIAKGAVECGGGLDIPMGSPNGDFWYYGKTAYEVNGSQAILASFNVSTGKFQGRLGRLLLNQRTTLEDVRRYFPQAAKAADVPATGRPGGVMSLPFIYKGTPADASLNLIFKQGHLQEVEFWYPC